MPTECLQSDYRQFPWELYRYCNSLSYSNSIVIPIECSYGGIHGHSLVFLRKLYSVSLGFLWDFDWIGTRTDFISIGIGSRPIQLQRQMLCSCRWGCSCDCWSHSESISPRAHRVSAITAHDTATLVCSHTAPSEALYRTFCMDTLWVLYRHSSVGAHSYEQPSIGIKKDFPPCVPTEFL